MYSLVALIWISWWVIGLAAFPPCLILLHNGKMPCGRRKGGMFYFEICHAIQNGPAEFASHHHCGIHSGHTSSRDNLEKWHLLKRFGPKSHEQCVPLLVMHRSSALVGSKEDRSTYHNNNDNDIHNAWRCMLHYGGIIAIRPQTNPSLFVSGTRSLLHRGLGPVVLIHIRVWPLY